MGNLSDATFSAAASFVFLFVVGHLVLAVIACSYSVIMMFLDKDSKWRTVVSAAIINFEMNLFVLAAIFSIGVFLVIGGA